MPKLAQYRDPDLSLWQSAVDEVVATKQGAGRAQDVGGAAAVARPDISHNMVHAAAQDLTLAAAGKEPAAPPPAPATEGIGGTIAYCSTLARKLAVAALTGNKADETRYRAELGQYGQCDPKWAETVDKYIEFQKSKGQVPYRVYSKMTDYVIDGKLPDKARVAIVGDWGTGQDEAKQVLAQIARKKPDVAIHLGDIYYSCTKFEVDTYFTKIWTSLLPGVPSYTLAGNHDMFGGGAPYYALLDTLGQPASYFCLRNAAWQFIAIDTGLHDRKPGGTDPTYLEQTEVDWVKDKVASAGGRRSVLLSHHQLFSAYEDIVPNTAVNDKLRQQLAPIFPKLTAWLWGHEHNLVIYENYLGVLGRCIGHGAFPVGVDEPLKIKHPEVPTKNVPLDKGDSFYAHGYLIMDLNGSAATLNYYQDTDEDDPQYTEALGTAAALGQG